MGINFIFWLSYSAIVIYTILMSLVLFIKPEFFKWLLVKITAIKLLKRLHESAIKQGDDIWLRRYSKEEK